MLNSCPCSLDQGNQDSDEKSTFCSLGQEILKLKAIYFSSSCINFGMVSSMMDRIVFIVYHHFTFN